MKMPYGLVFILLSACSGPRYISDDQLAAMPDDQLCAEIKQYPKDQRLIAFMDGHKLQCHPVQITCQKAGFKSGTKAYNDCTSKLINQMMSEDADKAAARRAYGAALLGKSHVTNCQAIGNTASCQSF